LLRASETRKRRKRRLPIDEDEGGPARKPKKTSRLELETSSGKPPRTPKSMVKPTGAAASSTPKSGLTVADTTAISQAIETYREFNNMTQRQVNEMIQRPANSAAGKVLWASIYEEVPSLPRRSIQQFCRRNFHNYEGRGVWTAEQDEELREAYQRHPNKWTDIGQELNRFPEDARDRWRNYLVCAGNMKKDVWDKVEEAQLRTAVAECIQSIREDRRRTGTSSGTLDEEERLIDWQKVSEKMNHTRSRLQCSYKWKKLNAADESDDEENGHNPIIGRSWRLRDAKVQARTMSAAEKLRLLRAIRDSGARREGKIPWRSIALEFKETGKRMAWKVCFRRLKNRLPGSQEMNFERIVERLISVFEASAPNEPEGFELNPFMSSNTQHSSISQVRTVERESDPLATDSDEEEQVIKALSSKRGPKSMQKTKPKDKIHKDLNGDDMGEPSSTTKEKGKVRDRLRRHDESTPEPADTTSGAADGALAIDGEKVVVAGLQLLKASKGKGRKSKFRQFLSEEIVVEDPTDDEDITDDLPNSRPAGEDDGTYEVASEPGEDTAVKVKGQDNQVNEAESVDLDDESAPSPNDLQIHEHSDISEDESAPESANEIESIDLDEGHPITTNGFGDSEESDVNEENAESTKSFDDDNGANESGHQDDDNIKYYHRIANKHVENYFDNASSDSESVSSSDSSVSSIPARVYRQRDTSMEL